jgi:hypothetical protein
LADQLFEVPHVAEDAQTAARGKEEAADPGS